MPAPQRIEIVQTNADQPWHVRLIRHKKAFVSEKYSRKVGAERAIVGLAIMFGWQDPHLVHQPDGDHMLVDMEPGWDRAVIDDATFELDATFEARDYEIPVYYLDERLTT